MRSLVTRTMTALSMLLLLLVAVLVVRVKNWSSEQSIVSITVPHSLYTGAVLSELADVSLDQLYASTDLPEMEVVAEVRVARHRAVKAPSVKFLHITKEVKILDEVFAPASAPEQDDAEEWRQLQGSVELPKTDTIAAKPVQMTTLESTSLVALLDNVKLPHETEVARAPAVEEVSPEDPKEDQVSLVQAAKQVRPTDEDAEPEFIQIDKKPEVAATVTSEGKNPGVEAVPPEYSLPEGWDLPVGSQQEVTKAPNTTIKVDNQLVTYGYVAPAGKPVATPEVAVSTQLPKATVPAMTAQVTTSQTTARASDKSKQREVATQNAMVTLAPLSVGMSKRILPLKNFEVRAKDDDAESWQDAGKGRVVWNERVGNGTYSRGLIILQEEHVPTHVDMMMVPGQEGHLEVPVFTQERLEALQSQTGKVPTGFVLVDMDEATEAVMVDGAKPSVTKLNGDFVPTKGEDYRYILLSGVEAGNRTLSFKLTSGKKAYRLIHVHERELTFDPNLYASETKMELSLNEEDLLAKKQKPLVISGEKAQMFFSGQAARKLSPNRYAFSAEPRALGARQYLTLAHQGEDVFVGLEASGKVDVPSESLMREVIKRFHLAGNARACIVQVNLDRAAKRYQVQAESYGEGHVSYGLALDSDGEFYESLGEGSRRLFLMSENQSGSPHSDNARLNVRIEYQDGSFRSFPTYCSPNTYLVEQL